MFLNTAQALGFIIAAPRDPRLLLAICLGQMWVWLCNLKKDAAHWSQWSCLVGVYQKESISWQQKSMDNYSGVWCIFCLPLLLHSSCKTQRCEDQTFVILRVTLVIRVCVSIGWQVIQSFAARSFVVLYGINENGRRGKHLKHNEHVQRICHSKGKRNSICLCRFCFIFLNVLQFIHLKIVSLSS